MLTMNETQYAKKTILYLAHRSLGGRMENLEGYEVPIQYEGISEEHLTTRESVSIFDSCYMGKFRISGETACKDLENIFTCQIGTLNPYQCKYGLICNENGGIIDSSVVYRITQDKFLVVVNAINRQSVFTWIVNHKSEKTTITDISHITAKLDLQGPGAPLLSSKLINGSLKNIDYYNFKYDYYKSTKILISRTGLTGEIGFEIFCPHDIALSLWNDFLALGAKPAGFGCSDTLRIEMGFPHYGYELDSVRLASETGLKYLFASNKSYIGSDNISNNKLIQSTLAGMLIDTTDVVQKGNGIESYSKYDVGVITSGCFSPCLQKSIALGYVNIDYANPGTKLIISTKKKKIDCTITELPFYKNATYKNPIFKYL